MGMGCVHIYGFAISILNNKLCSKLIPDVMSILSPNCMENDKSA